MDDSLEGRLTDPNLDEQVHEVVRQLLIEAEATTLDSPRPKKIPLGPTKDELRMFLRTLRQFLAGVLSDRADLFGEQAAGLTPIGLHECRHSYAAYMIAANINSKST